MSKKSINIGTLILSLIALIIISIAITFAIGRTNSLFGLGTLSSKQVLVLSTDRLPDNLLSDTQTVSTRNLLGDRGALHTRLLKLGHAQESALVGKELLS